MYSHSAHLHRDYARLRWPIQSFALVKSFTHFQIKLPDGPNQIGIV
ncbi:DUF5789 family protein [Levilactobacillus lanxiensis]